MDVGMDRPKQNLLKMILLLVLVIAVVAIILMPGFVRTQPNGRISVCMINLKQQGLAICSYSEDYNNHLPLAATWCDSIKRFIPYRIRTDARRIEKLFTCPSIPSGNIGGYAFNSAASGLKVTNTESSRLIMIFESSPGWNIRGHSQILLKEPRHYGGWTFLLEDGHAMWQDRAALSKLVWTPAIATPLRKRR